MGRTCGKLLGRVHISVGLEGGELKAEVFQNGWVKPRTEPESQAARFQLTVQTEPDPRVFQALDEEANLYSKFWHGYNNIVEMYEVEARLLFMTYHLDVMTIPSNISARAFYEPDLVSKFVEGYCNIKDLNRPLSDQDRIRVKNSIWSKLVYRDGRQYKISGVSTSSTTKPIDNLSRSSGETKTPLIYSVQSGRQASIAISEKYEPVSAKWSMRLEASVCRWVEDWDYEIIICIRRWQYPHEDNSCTSELDYSLT
ncbi:hypothetical protein Vadar_006034 [Vaccinium darrowii]|uniref:Uncharacterized protein n=1 Tax=Vaccinium darrowii TaxID=229202 RepID=A0ACB7Y6D6_9ERIC|nr:hypothetical protein Vadar_006034 [Vaccinium darrowii]